MSTTTDCDVIVVGAGAAGGWAAKELSEGGLRVQLLEAGPDRGALPSHSADLRPATMTERLRAGLVAGQPVQARLPGYSKALAPYMVNDRQVPYRTPKKAPFLWFRGRQVGGRQHSWARTCLRMSPFELDQRSARTPHEMRWPIGYNDLAPYYDHVERFLRIQGLKDGVANIPDGAFVEPVPVAPSNALFAERLAWASGVHAVRNRVSTWTGTTVSPALEAALATGRVTVTPNAVARQVTVDPNTGLASGVGWHDAETGDYHESRAQIVVLCASAFETVRLLLNSACPSHPGGIGAGSGMLGRYVSDHIVVGRSGLVGGAYADANRTVGFGRDATRAPSDFGGYHTMLISDFTGRWGPKPDFPGGYGIQVSVLPPIWTAMAFGEMALHPENCVKLHPSCRDAWGIPAAQIDIRHRESDLRMISHMTEALDEISAIGGLVTSELPPLVARGHLDRCLYHATRHAIIGRHGAFHPGAAIHENGGAHMGDSPRSSVVNRFGQCWEAHNLFVTDAACFVSPGFQNPTLTIMALTVRSCDFILRRYRNERALAD